MMTIAKGKKMLLGGKWMEKEETISVYDPQDNSIITTVPKASKEDMLKAITAAEEGAKIAENMPAHERIAIINKAADYVDEKRNLFAETIASEGSKTIAEAKNEVFRCIHTLRVSAEEARRINGETIAFDQMPGHENRAGYYYRFPIGIIAAITPFNDPLNLVAHKVGPAIASGNAIIVKPATLTPLSALLLAEAFDAAGLPRKILSVVTGSGSEIGDVLITHPSIRMVSFTGGLETGENIARKAGLKKLSMELGSNSPAIVLKDADIDAAVSSCVAGAFGAVGQNCLGVQRVFIEKENFDKFVRKFVLMTSQYKIGDKKDLVTDMGPLITEKEAIRVEQWVNEAIEEGASLLVGGKRDGAFYSPTVLTNVPADAKIAKEEIFGPVVILFQVNDLNEAIEKANNVNYGLQAGIFTKDINLAFTAIKKLEVGGIMINDSSDYRIDAMPFGGVKGSGLGREGVKYTIQEMTEPKIVNFKLG
ncbi:aldehyde dehydrogenase family protein [Pseudogracilibacillus sp. SO30301A]|uniref:aldehyde dehydrogenase family protein n=1 Tax=Pseudogracilibacillus sp. SO30301A TaxID=3098291 RepID=UPI00300E689F